jgi:S1-C subfamily serine protease
MDKKLLNKHLQHSIVKIRSECSSFNWFNPQKTLDEYRSVGTGFFINDQGYILTCNHVIENAFKIYIIIPIEGKEKIEADVVSICPDNDLALLKIKNYQNKYFLDLADSDTINQQDKVIAVGYPLSSDNLKFSSGIISGLHGILLQTDAPINEGNSGGPLVKLNIETNQYHVIGVNSSKVKSSIADNIGYSVPINIFKIIHKQMLSNKIVYTPELLVWFNNSNNFTLEFVESPDSEDNECNSGYFITYLDEMSPLYKVGVRPNDILCSFDNCKIDNYGECRIEGLNDKIHLSDLIKRYIINQSVNIKFWSHKLKKMENQTIILNIDSNIFKIKKHFFGFEKIDYEIIAGMIVMELSVNHLESLKDSNVDFNKSVKLFEHVRKEKRFNSVLFIANIFQGSYISSTDNVKVGSIIEKINDIKVTNIKEFRQAYLNPIMLKNKYYLTIETDNFNKIIVDIIKIQQEEIELAKRYNYKLSSLNDNENFKMKKYIINKLD